MNFESVEDRFEGIPPTGNKIKVAGTHILRVENGKIREFWALEDTLGQMQQLGGSAFKK